MHPDRLRAAAVDALDDGLSLSAVSRDFGVSRSALRAWRDGPRARRSACPRCGRYAFDEQAYAALLGYYLGDGCVSRLARYCSLRVSCDAKYPGIIADVQQGDRTGPAGAPSLSGTWSRGHCRSGRLDALAVPVPSARSGTEA